MMQGEFHSPRERSSLSSLVKKDLIVLEQKLWRRWRWRIFRLESANTELLIAAGGGGGGPGSFWTSDSLFMEQQAQRGKVLLYHPVTTILLGMEEQMDPVGVLVVKVGAQTVATVVLVGLAGSLMAALVEHMEDHGKTMINGFIGGFASNNNTNGGSGVVLPLEMMVETTIHMVTLVEVVTPAVEVWDIHIWWWWRFL